jgi:DNA-binding IclR family transcriptional regulator
MLSARLDVGSRVPLPNAALGRAYLSAVGDAERTQLLESMRLLRGSDWPALEHGLRSALADANRLGYCLSAGEFHREINSVSVPLVGPNDEVMALNCGGPAFVFSEERLRSEVAPQLRELAKTIAHDIGGHVPALKD